MADSLAMSIRASIAIAMLAMLTSLAPAYSFSEESEDTPLVRCGAQYMTLFVTGGDPPLKAGPGPLIVRKTDVRAIYAAHNGEITMLIDIGKAVIRATIAHETIRPVVECLD